MDNLRDIEHSAEENDELILCRTLGGYVIETPKGMLVSYNPQSAQTIPEWLECTPWNRKVCTPCVHIKRT
jgi:hypothetical protein